MLNKEILNKILVDYKKMFVQSIWQEEHFKWEAIKHFHDNWDIDAENFATMLKKSLDKCGILLFSMHNFSAGMIINFAKVAPEETKSMFIFLFDESISLSKRIAHFQRNSIKLREKYDDGTWMEDFQNTNAISIYLWLKYPDKYYIYKYPVVKTVSDKLKSSYKPQKSNNPKNFIECFSFYDEIHDVLIKDPDIRTILDSVITPECYEDKDLRTMTIDLAYYIYRNYKGENSVSEFKQLSVEDWYNLLNNPYVFNESALKIMKRIKDFASDVSCYQLSVKYGESEVYYISEAGYLARHIAETLDLDINPQTDDIKQLLSIIYEENPSSQNENKSFICKLKRNLNDALDKVDLSNVQLYEDMNPAIWKVNHSLEDFSQQDLDDFEYKKRIVVNSTLKPIGTSPLSQGDNFILAAKQGDYFYLCNDDKVRLIGQFTTNKASKCLKMGNDWYQRDYIEIATIKANNTYTSIKKWWTPNISSNFIKVPDLDIALFQDLILKPYFDLSIEELFKNNIKDPSYWLINANPSFWTFDDMNIGEERTISLYNDNGNKRKIFQNFLDAKAGDIIICYEGSPSKQIVAMAEITKETDGHNLYFQKVESLNNAIDFITLKGHEELRNMEFFTNPLGILFKLNQLEFDCILDLIREANPLEKTNGVELYDKEKFLHEVFMRKERLDTLISLLKHKKNIIIQGASGVGKTFTAKRLAYTIIGKKDDSHVELIQFHANYSYEDFILNFRPQEDGKELIKGIFYRFCQKAGNNPEEPYFFIIDDINRGNLRKIFGEVCLLMEKDYRGTKATLAYSGMPFSIPQNIYIIGMMNTADKAVAKIDYTLRRRFSFFDMYPAFESKGFKDYQSSLNNSTLDKLIDKIKDLNAEIEEDPNLGEGYCIGHSYFTSQKECSVDWLKEVVEFDLIPLLSEYWNNDIQKLSLWEKELMSIFVTN
jgi:hypothetical protein